MSKKTKSKSKTAPAAAASAEPKPVVLTVTIFPLKHGKRPLVISGAPDGEMPVVRAGNFSEIHSLFDELWLEMIKRKPKVVTKPATSTTKSKQGKGKDSAGGDAAESGEPETEATESEETGEASPEAVAEFEQSVLEAKASDEPAEADQLVLSVPETAAEIQEQLPMIEGDPTAE